MDIRRLLLLTACLCAAVLLGGCQISMETLEEAGDAVEEPYVIGIENETEQNVAGPLREAVDWWDGREHEYDSAWEGEFVVRPDAENPDIVVLVADTVDCNSQAQACAPKYNDSTQIALGDSTMRFGLADVPNRAGLVKTLKHELGHVRGVSHCEPPHWLMGCPDSAAYEDKNYNTRDFAWRTQTLSVYLETDDPTARGDVRAVLDEYENSSATPADLRLRFVDDPWLAHIHLGLEGCDSCGYGWDPSRLRGGHSYDSDNELEFLYWANVSVTAEAEERQTAVRNALEFLFATESDSTPTG